MKQQIPSRPRLRHCTMLDSGPDLPLRLIVGRSHFELREIEGDRPTFLQFKSLLDGRHTEAEIAQATGLLVEDVAVAVAGFEALGLLRREPEQALIPAGELSSRLAATLHMWRNQIGFHRLFQGLSNGRWRVEVLQGLFIETWHMVRMAPVHIGTALSAARSDQARALLSAYLADECSHAHLILETCSKLGCDPVAVARAHPIVATTSLVQMLCEIGRTDTLAYAAALGLFETAPQDGDEGDKSIARVARAYGLPQSHFAAAREHFREDLEARHGSMLELLLGEHGQLPATRVHDMVNMLHDLKHGYDQLHDGILTYYGDISNYVPRLAVDYFSL